jgi:alkylhydroperoxidase family enzyme
VRGIHTRELDYTGEISERIYTVAAWRETPYFSDAERAALALTEAATRLADRPDPVPDEVWDETARRYSEPQLAALVVAIATINAYNRLNATTRQTQRDYQANHRGLDGPDRPEDPPGSLRIDSAPT